ncbi:ATP-binding protein [Edaphobacter aggregans]|uniref:ATP-binding protein n=1 Tax=Edaphobacter aggregans TaxID=570835 RepID=UPI0005523F54|nr:ATP-binding protein [Edaphobacter aggregans]
MRFLILRILTHSELGMFHEYRRQKKEKSKQRAVNVDADVVDRVFPAAKDSDQIDMNLMYDTDHGIAQARQWFKRQDKNWRLEGNCPKDKYYHFVDAGCLFAMEVDSGSVPASGSWAVFPADHPVTKAILAHGESGGLAKSAMIALHDEEGERAWQVLEEARPDLFTRIGGGNLTKVTSARKGNRGVKLDPNPSRLVKILASVGHTLPSAVADIVDNAISNDATKIDITFGRPDGGHGRWLSITDNGTGMDPDNLSEAMRIGSDIEYETKSLGKYGYGLKGASWSQAKVFTVVTKRPDKPASHLTWDSDDMDGWVAKSDPLDVWEQQATAIKDRGTVVLWKDMRPPQAMPTARGISPHSAEIMLLERHLALVFHRFLEGRAAGRKAVAISINKNSIKPNNPCGHPLASAYDIKTIRIPTESEDGKVQVQAYLLPSEDEINNHHKSDGPEGVRQALDLIGLHGKRNETQGLFIYRHDRLIKWGGWHQMWATNDEKTKLARVIVDFDKVLDDPLKIDISKQKVELPQQLQEEIKKIADVVRRESQRKYRKMATPGLPLPRGGDVSSEGTKPIAPTPVGSSADQKSRVQPEPQPRTIVKAVKTNKFVWKVTKGLTGALDVQVSDLDPNLSALVKQIDNDSHAIAHLAAFLGGLDEVEVQKFLLAKKSI